MTMTVLFLFHPMLDVGSFAHARKRSPPKAYSFLTEQGKASQAECDGEWKIPRRLSKNHELKKAPSYMGSELEVPVVKSEANTEIWKHYFRAKPLCNQALANTPSSRKIPEKEVKAELPPEEDPEQTEPTEQPEPQE